MYALFLLLENQRAFAARQSVLKYLKLDWVAYLIYCEYTKLCGSLIVNCLTHACVTNNGLFANQIVLMECLVLFLLFFRNSICRSITVCCLDCGSNCLRWLPSVLIAIAVGDTRLQFCWRRNLWEVRTGKRSSDTSCKLCERCTPQLAAKAGAATPSMLLEV